MTDRSLAVQSLAETLNGVVTASGANYRVSLEALAVVVGSAIGGLASVGRVLRWFEGEVRHATRVTVADKAIGN